MASKFFSRTCCQSWQVGAVALLGDKCCMSVCAPGHPQMRVTAQPVTLRLFGGHFNEPGTSLGSRSNDCISRYAMNLAWRLSEIRRASGGRLPNAHLALLTCKFLSVRVSYGCTALTSLDWGITTSYISLHERASWCASSSPLHAAHDLTFR